MKYQTVITQMTVTPEGSNTLASEATEILIEDQGAGPYVALRQQSRSIGEGITIDGDSWPTIRKAIDDMLAVCEQLDAECEK
jgi:hypothetical protein